MQTRSCDASRRALLVDLDGTLAQSLDDLERVFYEFLARFGVTGTRAEFDAFNGVPLAEIVRTLKARHAIAAAAQDLVAIYSGMARTAHRNSRPADGARELLGHARRERWLIGVVTSSPRDLAQSWLDQNGLSCAIDVLVASDDVERGKPSPEPYLAALERAGCEAASSIAVEDSRNGARSAVAAGIRTFAIAGPGQREGWPDGVSFVSSLGDVRLGA